MTDFIKGLKSPQGIHWLVGDELERYFSKNPVVISISKEQFGVFYEEVISSMFSLKSLPWLEIYQMLFAAGSESAVALPRTAEAFLANEEHLQCLPEILDWANGYMDMKAYEVSA